MKLHLLTVTMFLRSGAGGAPGHERQGWQRPEQSARGECPILVLGMPAHCSSA
jgi:hypothetical protein